MKKEDRDIIRTSNKLILINLFFDIDNAIKDSLSDIPVPMKDSKFLKKYNEIKRRYLK